MTAHPLTWEELTGFGFALYAREGDGAWICVLCAGAARLLVHREGEKVACAACGEAIVSVAELEGGNP